MSTIARSRSTRSQPATRLRPRLPTTPGPPVTHFFQLRPLSSSQSPAGVRLTIRLTPEGGAPLAAFSGGSKVVASFAFGGGLTPP